MKNVLYYHVYLTDDYGTWSSMIMEQMKMMQDYRLLDILDSIRITCITQDDERVISFANLMLLYGSKDKFQFDFKLNPYKNDAEMLSSIDSDETITENATMRKIWNDSQTEDMRVLYLHTKGITSVENLLKRGRVDTFRNYYYWRQYLNWGVIENWKKCRDALAVSDIAGVNYYDSPSPHFSGAFWWARSDYLKTLPDPSTKDWWNNLKANSNDPWLKTVSDRFRDEMWPCSNPDVKVYNVNELPQSKNPAGTFLPRMSYTEELFWHQV